MLFMCPLLTQSDRFCLFIVYPFAASLLMMWVAGCHGSGLAASRSMGVGLRWLLSVVSIVRKPSRMSWAKSSWVMRLVWKVR